MCLPLTQTKAHKSLRGTGVRLRSFLQHFLLVNIGGSLLSMLVIVDLSLKHFTILRESLGSVGV